MPVITLSRSLAGTDNIEVTSWLILFIVHAIQGASSFLVVSVMSQLIYLGVHLFSFLCKSFIKQIFLDLIKERGEKLNFKNNQFSKNYILYLRTWTNYFCFTPKIVLCYSSKKSFGKRIMSWLEPEH